MLYRTVLALGQVVAILFGIGPSLATADTITVPVQSDWQDAGRVLTRGGSGAWDRYIGDERTAVQGMASPCAMVKKGGTYYLYYVGADGLRSTDGGMRNRALGVATSTDGFTFTKHPNNPILEYQPNNNEEEGIYTCGAMLIAGGEVALYYQAMNAGSPTSGSVWADGRLALSSDGVHFVDQGAVLDHADSSVWGFGDELFPVMPFAANGNYYLYYLTNGPTTSWDLGIASGPQMHDLMSSKEVLSPALSIRGGTGSPIVGSSRIYVPTLLLKSTTRGASRFAVPASPTRPDSIQSRVCTRLPISRPPPSFAIRTPASGFCSTSTRQPPVST